MWVDATANLFWLIDREKIREFVQNCKSVGINTIVLDVKPISGHVLYHSKIAPKLTEWRGVRVPEEMDILQVFLEEAHAVGLEVHANINVLSEGHKMFQTGPAYENVDWQMVAYSRRRILSLPDGTPYERNPRAIVRRAEERIKAVTGLDARSLWLPEMEFYVLKAARYGSAVNKGYFELFSDTASWNDLDPDFPEHKVKMPDTGVGQIDAPRDAHANLRSLMVSRIEDAGYSVKYHHHELGGAGQCEIETYFDTMLRAADSVMVMKYMIHNTAREQGLCATFMPKPMNGAPGSGLHFHQYLEKDGKSLFYGGPDQYACLNDMARQYLGGLLKHSPALMGLCCPTLNSYRRFGVGLAAPMNLFFGDSNRSSALRIPGYSKNETEHLVEYRLPDATCNPYLAMAAQLMAGLHGIETAVNPTAEGFGPFDFNNYTLSAEERAKIKSGPTSLESALAALREDNAFLTAGDVFPADLVPTWIDLKMQEMDEQRRRPHPYEFELYFDF